VEEFIHFAPKRPDEQKRQRLELFLSSLCEALSALVLTSLSLIGFFLSFFGVLFEISDSKE
jgi:hypothetical protein